MNWLDKLERKFGKIYIPNLMLVITIGTVILYLICMATGSSNDGRYDKKWGNNDRRQR